MASDLWKPRWAGLVTLLRAVGHVLGKVDAAENAQTRRVVDAAWKSLGQSKPEPRLFWEFIEEERNNVVKAYQVGVGVNTIVTPGTGRISMSTGEESWTPGGSATFEAFVRSGPFKGRDPLQLCREAVEFWRAYLDDIDQRIAAGEATEGVGT